MRVLLQRVKSATIHIVKNEFTSSASIGQGLISYIGFQKGDDLDTCRWASKKMSCTRVFSDSEGRIKFALDEGDYELMLVPSVTLSLSPRKRSMNFEDALDYSTSFELFQKMVEICETQYNIDNIAKGEFGTHMEVVSHADGPINVFQSSSHTS